MVGCSSQIAARLKRAVASDRGAVSVQLVVLVPALMVILMTIVQFALLQHAHHIAQSAASRALAAARIEGGSAADGDARAQAVLSALGTGVLVHPQVAVLRDSEMVRVEIKGSVVSIVPGMHLTVRAVASGPNDTWSTSGSTFAATTGGQR